MSNRFARSADPDDAPGEGPVRCPHCGSLNTSFEQRKGTSICRVLYYCEDCAQPFEEFR